MMFFFTLKNLNKSVSCKKKTPKKHLFGCCIYYPKVVYHHFYHIYSKQPPQMWYFIHPQTLPAEKVVNFLIYTL